jgi:hypothetical protein
MGFGETHWNRWTAWYAAASADERRAYKARWPEAQEWRGFYAFAENGESPPWLVDRERRIALAAVPPTDGEEEIREPDRMAWLLRSYLRSPKVRVRVREYAGTTQIFVGPDGTVWCLALGDEVFLYRYQGELVGEDNLTVARSVL